MLTALCQKYPKVKYSSEESKSIKMVTLNLLTMEEEYNARIASLPRTLLQYHFQTGNKSKVIVQNEVQIIYYINLIVFIPYISLENINFS